MAGAGKHKNSGQTVNVQTACGFCWWIMGGFPTGWLKYKNDSQ